jgi:hypothetical protein
MNEETARHVVDGLRERGVDAHLAEEGVYELGVRVLLSDGREALWGADGTDILAAEVMSDGDLVGFVPEIEGSEDFSVADIVDAISRADYSRPEGRELPEAPPPAPPLPVEGGVFRRFFNGFRSRD